MVAAGALRTGEHARGGRRPRVRVCAPERQRRCRRPLCPDRSTGAERWRQEAPDGGQLAPPTVADGIVYAPSANSGLFAFDGLTCSVRWNVAKTVPMGGHPPAITADVVYAAANRSIGAYDRADGPQLWSVDLGDDTDGSAIVSGGMAFIGDNAGSVLALAEPALAERIAAMGPSPTPTGSARRGARAVAAARARAGSRLGRQRHRDRQVDGLDLGPYATSTPSLRPSARSSSSTRRPLGWSAGWASRAPARGSSTSCARTVTTSAGRRRRRRHRVRGRLAEPTRPGLRRSRGATSASSAGSGRRTASSSSPSTRGRPGRRRLRRRRPA